VVIDAASQPLLPPLLSNEEPPMNAQIAAGRRDLHPDPGFRISFRLPNMRRGAHAPTAARSDSKDSNRQRRSPVGPDCARDRQPRAAPDRPGSDYRRPGRDAWPRDLTPDGTTDSPSRSFARTLAIRPALLVHFARSSHIRDLACSRFRSKAPPASPSRPRVRLSSSRAAGGSTHLRDIPDGRRSTRGNRLGRGWRTRRSPDAG